MNVVYQSIRTAYCTFDARMGSLVPILSQLEDAREIGGERLLDYRWE